MRFNGPGPMGLELQAYEGEEFSLVVGMTDDLTGVVFKGDKLTGVNGVLFDAAASHESRCAAIADAAWPKTLSFRYSGASESLAPAPPSTPSSSAAASSSSSSAAASSSSSYSRAAARSRRTKHDHLINYRAWAPHLLHGAPPRTLSGTPYRAVVNFRSKHMIKVCVKRRKTVRGKTDRNSPANVALIEITGRNGKKRKCTTTMCNGEPTEIARQLLRYMHPPWRRAGARRWWRPDLFERSPQLWLPRYIGSTDGGRTPQNDDEWVKRMKKVLRAWTPPDESEDATPSLSSASSSSSLSSSPLPFESRGGFVDSSPSAPQRKRRGGNTAQRPNKKQRVQLRAPSIRVMDRVDPARARAPGPWSKRRTIRSV